VAYSSPVNQLHKQMQNTIAPKDERNAEALAHFEKVNAIYHKEVFTPNLKTVSHTIVRKRQHISAGLYQPYYVIRGTRKSDGVFLFECVLHPIEFADGTTSIYWDRKNGNRFVLDNVTLP